MTRANAGMVIALGVLAVACGSCAAPTSDDAKLHLAAAPEDFKALGIGPEIEVREDGRRTPQSPDYFEWWYFDGLLDDGTVAVVWFGDNWFYGSHKRAVTIELTPPGKPTRRIMRTFDDPGAFSSAMQISKSVLIASRAISKPTPFTSTRRKQAVWAAI